MGFKLGGTLLKILISEQFPTRKPKTCGMTPKKCQKISIPPTSQFDILKSLYPLKTTEKLCF